MRLSRRSRPPLMSHSRSPPSLPPFIMTFGDSQSTAIASHASSSPSTVSLHQRPPSQWLSRRGPLDAAMAKLAVPEYGFAADAQYVTPGLRLKRPAWPMWSPKVLASFPSPKPKFIHEAAYTPSSSVTLQRVSKPRKRQLRMMKFTEGLGTVINLTRLSSNG